MCSTPYPTLPRSIYPIFSYLLGWERKVNQLLGAGQKDSSLQLLGAEQAKEG